MNSDPISFLKHLPAAKVPGCPRQGAKVSLALLLMSKPNPEPPGIIEACSEIH